MKTVIHIERDCMPELIGVFCDSHLVKAKKGEVYSFPSDCVRVEGGYKQKYEELVKEIEDMKRGERDAQPTFILGYLLDFARKQQRQSTAAPAKPAEVRLRGRVEIVQPRIPRWIADLAAVCLSFRFGLLNPSRSSSRAGRRRR